MLSLLVFLHLCYNTHALEINTSVRLHAEKSGADHLQPLRSEVTKPNKNMVVMSGNSSS